MKFEVEQGQWPGIAAEFTVEEAIWLASACQNYALSEPHEDPFPAGSYQPSHDLSWYKFTPLAHTAFHFVGRQLAAGLIGPRLHALSTSNNVARKESLDKGEKPVDNWEDWPSGINVEVWFEWMNGDFSSYDKQTVPLFLSTRKHYQHVEPNGDGFSAVLEWEGSKQAKEMLAAYNQCLELIPERVEFEYEEELRQVSETIIHVQDYGRCWWHPETSHVWWTGADADGQIYEDDRYGQTTPIEEIERRFGSLSFVEKVTVSDEHDPAHIGSNDTDGWLWVEYVYKANNM